MSFLRLAVLLFVFALFLPTTPEEKQQTYRGITTAAEQVRTFCVRNNALCENSKAVASAIYDRVKIGAQMLYETATGEAKVGVESRKFRREPARYENRRRAPERGRRTGLQRSRDTLRKDDRRPAWRGPGTS